MELARNRYGRNWVEVALSRFGLSTEAQEPLALVQHAFTHYKLAITPQPLLLTSKAIKATDSKPSTPYIWLPLQEAIGAAIPTPVRNILLSLQHAIAHYA